MKSGKQCGPGCRCVNCLNTMARVSNDPEAVMEDEAINIDGLEKQNEELVEDIESDEEYELNERQDEITEIVLESDSDED